MRPEKQLAVHQGRDKWLTIRERGPLLRREKIIIIGGETRVKANAHIPHPS